MTTSPHCVVPPDQEIVLKRWRVETFRVTLTVSDRPNRRAIRTPQDVVVVSDAIFRDLDSDREHFVILALDVRHRLVGFKVVASGSSSSVFIRPKEILRAALLLNADAIIAVHNHPSGDVEPSRDDLRITEALTQAGKLTGIEVLDHLVVGAGCFTSLRDRGMGF
jgi:DNA repair protein RadC